MAIPKQPCVYTHMTIPLPDLSVKYSIVDQHTTKWIPKHACDKPFTAWDGEGYTDSEGVHHYMLFGCSTGSYVKSPDLSHHQCFKLLLDVGQQRKANHVIFAGGYDVVMMIRHYPKHIIDRILQGHTTWYLGYRHEYFKSKFLKLSDGKRSIILYDVFTFFSTSFVKACREYLGELPDFDRIEAMKLQRDTFTIDDLETSVLPYMQDELHYLVELMVILRKRLLDAQINTRQWHGPGAVASTVLRQQGMKAFMCQTPDDVREAARHAYYGGRFEQFKVGFESSPVYQYDIRSAYPYAISQLPSLASIEWVHRTPTAKTAVPKNAHRFKQFGLYQITYASAKNRWNLPQPLPWRDQDKSIFYPPNVYKSWYWGCELATAFTLTTPGADWHISDAWEPRTEPYERPFAWIEQMYYERAKMKAEGNPTQLALKLAMNSIYGKLAQSKGARKRDDEWQLPRYHQLEWAGWITAATRARMYSAIAQAGRNAIACETDAVYTTVELPHLTVSDKLGDWERDIAEQMLYIQSGVYFKRVNGSWKLKTRGFEPRGHTFDNWFEVMSKLPSDTATTHTLIARRFGTDVRRDNFATWYEYIREANILVDQGKRIHVDRLCEACNSDHTTTLTSCMHPLTLPLHRINAKNQSSTPHQLPWVDDGMRAWEDDFTVTEDGMFNLDFGEEPT